MLFVDANIFLEVQLGDERKDECVTFLKKINEDELKVIISDFIVYTSLIQIDIHLKSIKIMNNFISFLKSLKSLDIFVPELETIENSFRFAEKYKLSFDDALVVSCMLTNKIKKLVSFDKDFDKIREIDRIEPKDVL